MNSIVALPIAAAVPTLSPLAAAHSDAELIALGKQFEALVGEFDAAAERTNELLEVFDATAPAKPEELLRRHPRKGNRFPWFGNQDGEYYSLESIEVFRQALSSENNMWGRSSEIRRIVRAANHWAKHRVAAREACGLTVSEEREERLYVDVHDVADRMQSIRPRTLEGLKVKARAAVWCRDCGREETGEDLMVSVLTSLEFLAA